MGTTPELLDQFKRLILRDRNHPSVILWSAGNEEWAIEGNRFGARLTRAMQEFAMRLDPTRRVTVASSGGWETGSAAAVNVMGYNYKSHGNVDQHHAAFPNQPSVATEEVSAYTTRGTYVDDRPNVHLKAYDWKPSEWGSGVEEGWNYFAARPFVAGMFVWSGFDYRGEPTPFDWPAIASQFGVFDLCGFPKDHAWYLKSWWSDAPMVHLLPHWNWPGKEGQPIRVVAYSNADEVELFLNDKTMGRKPMTKNSHVEWDVAYQPGTLLARAYRGGREVASETVASSGVPAAVRLAANVTRIAANGESVAVITVDATDAQGRSVPTAANEISFSLRGPGRIIGVGNGDPGSHEPDQFADAASTVEIPAWRIRPVQNAENDPNLDYDLGDSRWPTAFGDTGRAVVVSGAFQVPDDLKDARLTLLTRSLGGEQSISLNGQLLAKGARGHDGGDEIGIDPSALRRDKNVIAVLAIRPAGGWSGRGRGAAAPAVLRVLKPAATWRRSLFNGLAQVIVQSSTEPGDIVLVAESPGLARAELKIESAPAPVRPSVPAR
jgi:beta-galactosidase